MSGAGRSEAADVLEDLGFFVIDNLPPDAHRQGRRAGPRRARSRTRYALVVDVRSGDVRRRPRRRARRAARARRAHPRAVPRRGRRRARAPLRGEPPPPSARRRPTASATASRSERALLEELKGEADVVVDTSNLNVHELRDRLARAVRRADAADGALQVNVVSFGYKHGLPARRRPRVRLPLPARTRTGSTSCGRSPAATPRCATTCSAQPGTRGVPRRARAAVRAARSRLRARGQGVPVDRRRLHRRAAPQRRDRRAARRAPARASATAPRVHHRDVDRD